MKCRLVISKQPTQCRLSIYFVPSLQATTAKGRLQKKSDTIYFNLPAKMSRL